MSHEHTPWTAEWIEESSDWVVMGCAYAPDAEGIAWQPNICTLSDTVSGDVARLIAAAPELLEAIQPKTLRGVAVACRNASLPGQAACLEKLAELQEAAIARAKESGQ